MRRQVFMARNRPDWRPILMKGIQTATGCHLARRRARPFIRRLSSNCRGFHQNKPALPDSEFPGFI